MCNALGSRTAPSRRSAFGHVASSFADVCESPLANRVTSCPSATSSSVSQCTTRSVPPYSLGGTASVSGATCAMRILPSPVIMDETNAPVLGWHRHADRGTFPHLRSSLYALVLLPSSTLLSC